ncbi:unnamed protein product [Didymodactylos carnosus]|uniref:Transmembrane protein 163 n=1 Tax=Didymodactylos carnosus TaxID=1234261 RepID=A0A813PFX9_9BILA|nr:unnamed protein product [Didymodactylos carnosus]CAF0754433.1 unnamed protein product [Didymodactylos carnosus]CAF3519759.1 unnamed protein product [Didymodactylos carnosus]CAF3534600.1 unnamed protein product [Didymodactylos carnosus]
MTNSYERFDYEPNSKPVKLSMTTINNDNRTTLGSTNENEKLDLVLTKQNQASNDEDLTLYDDKTTRHSLVTLNIISIVVSSVCGVITFFLAIEEQSASALGFAVDTILDVLSFIAIIWRFVSSVNQLKREIYVLRIMSILFFISGLGVFLDSVLDIRHKIKPIPNRYLVIAAAVQTIVFGVLAFAKAIVAKKLNVISAYSDAFNTSISAFMALSVTVSVTVYNLNSNVWYLDPMVGLAISIIIMVYGVWMLKKSFQQ